MEVINARETVPNSYVPGLLDQCEQAQPLGTGEALGEAPLPPLQATGADQNTLLGGQCASWTGGDTQCQGKAARGCTAPLEVLTC